MPRKCSRKWFRTAALSCAPVRRVLIDATDRTRGTAGCWVPPCPFSSAVLRSFLERFRVVDHVPERILVRLLVHERRQETFPPAGRGQVTQRIVVALRRPLPAEGMPQPTLRPDDPRVPIGPLEPVRRKLPADRPLRVVLHWEDQRAPDRRVLGPELQEGLLGLLGHRHHPRSALFVELGAPGDGPLLEIEVVPPEPHTLQSLRA